MIHIAYGDSAAGCLREAIDKHGLPGDGVVPSRDDLTQGPLRGDETQAYGYRISYWAMIGGELDFDMDVHSFYQESIQLLDSIDDDEVTIWQGDSVHDILATAWLLTHFQDRDLQWSIVDLAQVPLEEGDTPAINVAMYDPSNITQLYAYRQSLGDQAIQMYFDLWSQMVQENGPYRIIKDRVIRSVDEDFHDQSILSGVSSSYEEAAKVIGMIMRDSEHNLSDTTVEWRIRQLIKANEIESRGELKSMRDYEIRRALEDNT